MDGWMGEQQPKPSLSSPPACAKLPAHVLIHPGSGLVLWREPFPLLVICSYACTPFSPGCGSQLSPEPRAVSEVLPQAQPGKLPVSFHRAFLALP